MHYAERKMEGDPMGEAWPPHIHNGLSSIRRYPCHLRYMEFPFQKAL